MAEEVYSKKVKEAGWTESTEAKQELTGESDDFPSILQAEVRKSLSTQKIEKAVGPHGLDNRHLKLFALELTPILTKLFNKIIGSEIIPTQWREAEIILLFKKGKREDIKNYRPISLTSNLGKIFMKILEARIYPQLDAQQPHEQAGYRRNRSTIDQIFILK